MVNGGSDTWFTHLGLQGRTDADEEVSDILRLVKTAFTVAAIVYAIRTKQSSGRLLKVPYDFRFPTIKRVKERWWNRTTRGSSPRVSSA